MYYKDLFITTHNTCLKYNDYESLHLLSSPCVKILNPTCTKKTRQHFSCDVDGTNVISKRS
ncbi:hypothetical protein Hanom_Chr09g00811941 [Helianthus anomalus]